jgi:transglutaminase-like putative cysteine protease
MLWRFLPATAFLFSVVIVDSGVCGERPREVSYEFRYTAEVRDLPESASHVDLWIPVPSDSQGQKVNSVNVVRPSDGQVQTEPQYQNRIFHKRFVGPFGKTHSPPAAELVFDVVRTEVVIPEAKALQANGHAGKPNALDVYLRPNRLIPIGGKVSQIAASLNLPKHDPLRVGRRLYDYLIDTMDYDWKAKGAGRGDVLWACDSKRGDCTDYHSTFIALCRSQGIPADHEFGFPIRTREKSGTIAHDHCWARFWVEGVGWIPVDISEADKHPELRDYNFGSQSPKLLKLTHGRDITLVPPQLGERLNIFVHPYVEVDGKPFQGVKWSMSFKEHSER